MRQFAAIFSPVACGRFTSLFLIPLAVFVVCGAFEAGASYGRFPNVIFHTCYDGDTCTFTIPGVHLLIGERISVRIRGIDAPEIRGRCQVEKRTAIQARDYLRSILNGASRIELHEVERGKCFRIVATLLADGVNVADLLIARGLARPYDGATERREWCESP